MSNYQLMKLPTAVEHWQNGDAVFVDIRDPQSFAAGHIPGSQRLDNNNLPQFLNSVQKNQKVVVVCYHGISSQGAADYIASQGFTEVHSMDGGYTAWSMSFPEHTLSEDTEKE
ncbi:thiosulfate sulfurtransferase GlpE [Idiomarina aminovorans]|uniref:thiosulfate sulfurtransferase GlpE n=1 Tax=Idiomarina aminovorans TaxID=2914829 RepID=UPI0020050B58|nr:thiosulfate sulfurtransferase GlpE [Idiomarina sp. ATCH4]MCK7458870.1 thiosulfate sulfurtransferase GlpE [Idiomarina sp. ATCH4]